MGYCQQRTPCPQKNHTNLKLLRVRPTANISSFKLLHRIIPPALTSSCNNAHQLHSTTNPGKINDNATNQGTPVIDKQLHQLCAAGKHPGIDKGSPYCPSALPNIQKTAKQGKEQEMSNFGNINLQLFFRLQFFRQDAHRHTAILNHLVCIGVCLVRISYFASSLITPCIVVPRINRDTNQENQPVVFYRPPCHRHFVSE